MPVLVERRLPEVGRIRIGHKGDRGQPQRLKNFRLTSKDKTLLDHAAKLYGGTPRPWQANEGQFELFTTVSEIPILISPEEPSQWYEVWSAGGCQRRCDGRECTIPSPDYRPDPKKPEPWPMLVVDCACDPDRRECKLVTRASFLLPELPGIGMWRFETGSVYAAMEMPGMLQLLREARARSRYPRAALAIETRKQVKAGQTKIFPVVTIRLREVIGDLIADVPQAAITSGNATQGNVEPPTRMIPAVIDQKTAEVREIASGDTERIEPSDTTLEGAVSTEAQADVSGITESGVTSTDAVGAMGTEHESSVDAMDSTLNLHVDGAMAASIEPLGSKTDEWRLLAADADCPIDEQDNLRDGCRDKAAAKVILGKLLKKRGPLDFQTATAKDFQQIRHTLERARKERS